MTTADLDALLDAHDALVRACVAGELPLAEFVLAYGEFPGGQGIDAGSLAREWPALAAALQTRLAFHRQVAALLSGLNAGGDPPVGLTGGAGAFLEKAVSLRLRTLLDRHPDCRGGTPGIGALRTHPRA
jgi:hypothetical protein